MAPRIAAVVWNASILLLFLFVCSVFSHSLTISFTRYKLLDIRQHTPDTFFPVFNYSDALLDVLVGGAVVIVKRTLRWKRGKLVYVPPDAYESTAMQQLAEQISEMEQLYPDSFLIIL